MNRRDLQIVLLILFVTINYSGLAQNTLENVENSLLGTWIWEKSVLVDRGGGGTRTPEDCNCTRKIIIYEDGVIEDYRNDTLASKSEYTISEYEFMNDPIKYIFNSESLRGQFQVTGDSFGIGPFGGCGVLNYFKRADRP